jgi:hypothetical protein
MERKPYIFSELFIGDENLFQEVLQNPETIFVYDIDGILANTPKVVFDKFSKKNGIAVKEFEMTKWNYLTELLKSNGFGKEAVEHAEDDWFKPEVLVAARRFLYIRPVVEKTVNFYGADRNFILTSRNPYFKPSTIEWIAREFPKIRSENVFIRDSGGIDLEISAKFKAEKLGLLAKKAPWVVFVDDSTDFVKAALTDGIQNCLVVNIPQGKIMPDFRHERLIIIKRYPEELQAMYPFMDAVNRALDGCKSPC